jgi:hypothetical protein
VPPATRLYAGINKASRFDFSITPDCGRLRYHERMKRHRLRQLFGLRKKSISLVVPTVLPAESESHVAVKIIGWSSLAVGIAALGVFVGREIRTRYKFKRRTPYDYYAHSGDQTRATADYGIGI